MDAVIPTKKKAILRTEKLQAYYLLDMQGTQKVVKAVNDVSLTIYENEIYGIAGESGCGKTTLLKALFNDFVPPMRLVGGKIVYLLTDGREVDAAQLSPEEMRQLRMEYIAYIPQGSMSVFNPVLKLKEAYEDFVSSHRKGQSREQTFELARQQIQLLGLPANVLDLYPHQLSGGMGQRVMIAMMLVAEPDVLIADEPTSALDGENGQVVIRLLRRAATEHGAAVICVTHDPRLEAYADRVIKIEDGRILSDERRTPDADPAPLTH